MSTSDSSMPGAFVIALCTLTISNNRLAKSPDQYFFLTRTAGPFRAKPSFDERFVEQDYSGPSTNQPLLAVAGLDIEPDHSKAGRSTSEAEWVAYWILEGCE